MVVNGKYLKVRVVTFLSVFLFGVCVMGAEDGSAEIVPTHADAVMFFAKYSGLFDRYVSADASLNDCVSFLNGSGVYFGLLEVVNGSAFRVKDCARVMGQMNLVFSGEADYLHGKVKLPLGVASWEEFCILNNVKYADGYRRLVGTTVFIYDLSR